MTTQEYIDGFKNKFGSQMSKDGQLIRDMNDFEVLDRALRRYPGDREDIDEIDLEEYYNTYDPKRKPPPPPPKTGLQKRLDELTGGLTEAFKNRRAAQEAALGKSIDGEQSIASGFLQAAGEGAGFIGDVGFEALKAATPDFIREPLGAAVETVAGSVPVQGAMEAYGGFKEDNPELAGDIEAVGNLATIIPGVGAAGKVGQVGAKAAKEGAEVVVDVANRGLNTAEKILDSRAAAQGIKEADKALNDALELTRPPLDKKETISAMSRAGQPGGLTKGSGGKYTITPNEAAIDIAKDAKGIISKKQGPFENLVSLNTEIGRIADTELRPFLKSTGQVYNPVQLDTYLRQLPKPLSLKANPESMRAYNLALQKALYITSKYPRTSEGLWDARQAIDDMIEKEFGSAAFDSPTGLGARSAAMSVRTGINDFIGDSVSNASMDLVNKMNEFIRTAKERGIEIENPAALKSQMNEVSNTSQGKIPGIEDIPDAELNKAFWKAKLKQMSNLYRAREAIAEQNWRLMNKTTFQRWLKEHPGAHKALGYGVSGTLGAGGAVGLGILLSD